MFLELPTEIGRSRSDWIGTSVRKDEQIETNGGVNFNILNIYIWYTHDITYYIYVSEDISYKLYWDSTNEQTNKQTIKVVL